VHDSAPTSACEVVCHCLIACCAQLQTISKYEGCMDCTCLPTRHGDHCIPASQSVLLSMLVWSASMHKRALCSRSSLKRTKRIQRFKKMESTLCNNTPDQNFVQASDIFQSCSKVHRPAAKGNPPPLTPPLPIYWTRTKLTCCTQV